MACFGDGYRWFVSGIIHDDTGFPVTNSPDMISASIDHMDFCGGSIFADFDGGVAARADDSEQLLYAQADLPGAAGSRKARQYLPLLRPEVFAP